MMTLIFFSNSLIGILLGLRARGLPQKGGYALICTKIVFAQRA